MHVKRGWNFLPSTLGQYIDVAPPQQRVGPEWYQGTADAVYQNFYTIRSIGKPYCLILAGDHVYKMDYVKMVDFHLEKGADVTVAAIDVPVEEGSDFGIIQIDESNRIIGFQEKPANPRPMPSNSKRCLVSMGIYIFNSDIMYEKLEQDARDKSSAHDFGRSVIPSMVKDFGVFCYIFQDENKKKSKYWRDVGTIDAYWEANMDLVNVSPQFNLYDRNWPVRTLHSESPPPKFVFAQSAKEGGRRGMALDSIVSPGCIISGGKVEGSVLSPDVRINSYSYVFESLLFDGVEIGRHCRIRRAIIDKDVSVPEGTVIGYDPEEDKRRFEYISPGGVVVIPKHAYYALKAGLPCRRAAARLRHERVKTPDSAGNGPAGKSCMLPLYACTFEISCLYGYNKPALFPCKESGQRILPKVKRPQSNQLIRGMTTPVVGKKDSGDER
jgi:glucose-1-phosphate adenylyltransferase